MKKRLLFVCVLCVAAALICLAGCQSQEKAPQEIEIDKDTVTITLEGNPTTGFTWACATNPQDVLKLERDEFIPSDTDGKVEGAGGLYTFVLKAQKAGKVTLKFEYSRSWEDVEAEKTYAYQLTVDDQLNVTLDK